MAIKIKRLYGLYVVTKDHTTGRRSFKHVDGEDEDYLNISEPDIYAEDIY